MTNVKFDYCGGCGLEKSLVLRGDSYRCMRCIRRDEDPDFGSRLAEEELDNRVSEMV